MKCTANYMLNMPDVIGISVKLTIRPSGILFARSGGHKLSPGKGMVKVLSRLTQAAASSVLLVIDVQFVEPYHVR